MAKSFDDKKEETSSARYLQFMKWKCISLIFHSCNKEENRDALIIKYSFLFLVLEDEDVIFLVKNTAFSESDIREWWR